MPAERGFEITEDAALGGRLRLKQPKRGHRFGHDAVLLAAATGAQAGDHVVEFGCGVGLAGLAVALRVPETRVTLVDIDPALVALAGENAHANGLAEHVRAITLDVTAPARAFAVAGLAAGSAQRVMMNPPFNDARRFNRSAIRGSAHMASAETLPDWCRAAARVLAPGGVLTLIWRADGLAEILAATSRWFGGTMVLPVYPRPDAPAIRVIVAGTRGSRAPMGILRGVTLGKSDGSPTAEAGAILRDGAALSIAAPLMCPSCA